MQQNVKNKLPQWYNDINKDDYYLVLTDDLDSYLSCLFLNKRFGVEIGAFYTFETLYHISDKVKGKEPIWVDCDVVNGKAFGNHVVPQRNNQCINLNMNIDYFNYTKKYAGSTLMTLFSLYDVDITKFSDYNNLFYLCIDSWYLQYYKFKDKWDMWVKYMDYGYLTEVLNKYDFDGADFKATQDELNLNAKITLDENGRTILFNQSEYDAIYEKFGVRIKPLDLVFDTKVKSFKRNYGNLFGLEFIEEKIFSIAQTYKNKISYSVAII